MEGERVQRRLAAILAADVAGYSRLTGVDEEGTIARLRALRRELVDPTVASHGGRIVKTTGDGILIEFASVVDAVRCAVEVQRAIMARNDNVPADKRIEFRVGIHVGDVVVDGDDLLGDGVNIVARLEGIAEPGGICFSGDAYRQVRGKVDLAVRDLGEQQLKNIAEPIRVYALAPASVPPIASATAASAHAPRLSVVVLPFTNLGDDKEQDYFVDGITESLTTDLSRLPGAFVIARNTAFTYKGKAVDARQIGRELGVRYVLEGSVQGDANRIRINVQLVNAESGAHLWAERFDRDRGDLFDMQDEIVARLASALRVELIVAEVRHSEQCPTENHDSLDLIFRGRAVLNRGLNRANIAEAERFFTDALTLEPENVEALVGLGMTKCSMATTFATAERAAHLLSAETAAAKALALSPHHAGAHFLLGVIYMATNRPALGVNECQEAIALDRNHAQGHAHIGAAQILLGRAEETEHHIAQALRLSPRDSSAYLWYSTAGIAKCALKKYEEGIEWLRRSILANRLYPVAYFALAAALAHQGKLDEARAEIARGRMLAPDFSIRRCREGAYSDNPTYLAAYEDFIAGLRKAELPEE